MNETVKMEPLDKKLRNDFYMSSTMCLAQRLLSSKVHNTQQTFQPSNLEFRRFLLEVSICCTTEIYNEGSDISSFPNTTFNNLHHLHPQNHLDRQPCWKKLRSRLIHTLTWLHFDYHGLCVWFGSCENRRLTQSRSSGVFHGWPVVKNAPATPNKISRT